MGRLELRVGMSRRRSFICVSCLQQCPLCIRRACNELKTAHAPRKILADRPPHSGFSFIGGRRKKMRGAWAVLSSLHARRMHRAHCCKQETHMNDRLRDIPTQSSKLP